MTRPGTDDGTDWRMETRRVAALGVAALALFPV
ncbi:MAG: hypothetical protein QOE60_1292, partial [Thermoleophilaceae bacterium]|nr:hypothetical protein [Thermoleophilaceae bacterium]